MWTKIFLLLLIGATALLAAPPETDSSAVCALNMELLKNFFHMNEKIMREEVETRLEGDSKNKEKSRDGDENREDFKITMLFLVKEFFGLAKKMEIFEEKRTQTLEKIAAQNSEMSLKLGKVEEKVENMSAKIKNVEELEEHLRKLERNFTEQGQQLNNEINLLKGQKKADDEKLEKLGQNLTECGQKFENASEQIKLLEEQIESVTCPKKKLRKSLALTQLDIGEFYFHPFKNETWADAKKFCVEHGMQLATLKTADKIKKLSDANPHKGITANQLWVDASDVGQQPGQFVWADGTKVDEALWGSGQPNDFFGGKETCVHFWTSFGKLFDYECSFSSYSFVCQVAGEDLTC